MPSETNPLLRVLTPKHKIAQYTIHARNAKEMMNDTNIGKKAGASQETIEDGTLKATTPHHRS
jgi:hypothetical protein